RPILVPDASQDARMVYPPGVAPIEESVLSVPMVTQNRLFGVLTLARLRARSLSLEDLRVMESIAAQTALALANAEQYAEAEQTIKALAMIETLQPTDDAVPDADIDRRILQGLVDLSQADLATLRTLRDDGRYHVAAAGGRSWPKNAVSTGEPLTAAQVAWLSDPKVTVYVADPATDQKLPDWARREFMQIASHELRTPLTVIRGYASLLEEGSLGEMPPPAQQAIRTLMDKSSEMRAQVERMLLLARLEDGAAPPQMAPLDLRTVVSE